VRGAAGVIGDGGGRHGEAADGQYDRGDEGGSMPSCAVLARPIRAPRAAFGEWMRRGFGHDGVSMA
jgi:hypothetical protein